MSCDMTQKQEGKADRRGLGPLLALMALFASPSAAAKLFQTVRWANGLACPHCVRDGREGKNVTKYCKYGYLQRYVCKDCNKTFNDKTGTPLHYKHTMVGDWMLSIWMFLAGPRNGISIRFIAESLGRTYKPVYYMMRGIMALLANLPEKALSGVGETDELYIRAASKGVPLKTNGEDRILPSRRGLPKGPGRGTFEKNTPMTTVYHQRSTKDEPDITIFDVHTGNSRTLAGMAAERFERGSTIITDEHPAYKSLEQRGYVHPTVNHSEGEYASGENNEIHTNNCECRAGLVKWWLKKHRGVNKGYLILYVKSFQFVHNHRHYDMYERFVVTLATILGQYSGRQAGEDADLETLLRAPS